MTKNLYEVLIPTIYGDTKKPIRTRHHKNFDARVLKISQGLTIMSCGKGKWVYKGEDYFEKVIPVRIFCTEKQIEKIVQITLDHYRQIAVMYYLLSEKCFLKYKE
jgi:hypothetical protein